MLTNNVISVEQLGPDLSDCSLHVEVMACINFKVQSTLVISKLKGPSKTVRDIRTSTYQICSIEEKTI